MNGEKLLRLPPRIKVLEAIGSIGDGRITVVNDREARVLSSLGDREYRVVIERLDSSKYRVYSSDNGTIYRGYIGYPIIAFLMLKGVIPIDRDVMKAMTGIPWKELNEKYKKYSIVERIVMDRAERIGVPRNIVNDYINIVMKKLRVMKLFFDEKLSK
ncbi:MAG: hypothetical protein DRO13_02310 [Thermoprotei archaeon]|nr:MAG: hypothetical protein DRO13_02310 [Thermoprotei archaeon]